MNIDEYKNNVKFTQTFPLRPIMLTPNTYNDNEDSDNYYYDMGVTFEVLLFSSDGMETYIESLYNGDYNFSGWTIKLLTHIFKTNNLHHSLQ